MKRKTRQGVFETNSSSVHTLTYKHEGDYELKLPVDKDGNLHAYCGNFSNSGDVYGQQEKLNYLVTYAELNAQIHYMSVEDTYLLRSALYAVQDLFPQVKNIIVHDKEKAKFDHQTAPYESSFIVEDYDNRSIQQFLFEDNLVVNMSRD